MSEKKGKFASGSRNFFGETLDEVTKRLASQAANPVPPRVATESDALSDVQHVGSANCPTCGVYEGRYHMADCSNIPDPATTCADCGGEMTGRVFRDAYCEHCVSEHEADRRVEAEESKPTEPAPPPEPEKCVQCGGRFDEYRRPAPDGYFFADGTCTNCNEKMLANVAETFDDPTSRVPKFYDEPPMPPLRMSSAARRHCRETAAGYWPGWDE